MFLSLFRTRPSPLGFLLRSGYGGQDGGQERGKAKHPREKPLTP
ncbi:MAG: hypothetical protein ABIE14_01725 [Patescibacteria group bacterium]